MDWPLPLWQVLSEELQRLRPTTTAAAVEQASPENPTDAGAALHEYRPHEILDADLLAAQLKLRRPELAPLLTKNPDATQPSEFAAHFVSGDESAPQTGTLPDIQFLNQLLKIPELYTAFPNLAESGWIRQWFNVQKTQPVPQAQVIELNRFLLDVAFAGGVQSIGETMLSHVVSKLHEASLSALCFSGGGIRSATFCLGVVQGLARKGMLDRFDYLSTVSGGGYLGSWLAAWTYWSKGGLPDVTAQLATAKSSKLEPEPDPIFYLRNFSNYLTPRTGFLSADTWTLIGIFLRNLLLHWSVILPPIIAILLVPYLLFALMRHDWTWTASQLLGRTVDLHPAYFAVAVVAMAAAVFYEGTARPSHLEIVRDHSTARPWLARRGQGSFLRYFLTPLMLSSFFFSIYIFQTSDADIGISTFILYGILSGFLGWLMLVILLRRGFLWNLLAVAISGIAGGALLYYVVASALPEFREFPTLYFCLMPPITMIVFLLAATIFIGLVTLFTSDEDREYWARIGAWSLIAILGWSTFGGVALFGPLLLLRWAIIWSLAGTATSAITTFFGWSSRTGANNDSSDGVLSSSLLQRALPLLGVIALLLIACALALAGIHFVQLLSAAIAANHAALEHLAPIFARWNALEISQLDSSVLQGGFSGAVVLLALLLMVILLTVTSLLIDVNKYSLHAMYRNRLIRAYLGASRRKGERQPNPFTGFDPEDNLPMWKLWNRKPAKLMPVLNISLNLVAPIADKLAWQERKAESYTVTPLHVGNFRSGYRRSEDYASNNIPLFRKPRPNDLKQPLTLGTATAISGAAVSPNMGYNSSPIVTILLSLFNVRLGWWLGNPGPAGNRTYMRGQPGFGIKYFADEALGRTSAEQKYVHLSDGGHFENLGLYEMVLRRCHTIVVIDADQDLGSTFDNLGNAIRKVRIDLGISIEFPNFPNFAKRNEGGKTTAYCAVGTIKYDPEDPDAPDGHLIYVKPTIVGDEPADVLNYERRCREFPHETTADQWFSESQFESYRVLGMYEIEKIIGDQFETNPHAEYALANRILDKLPRATP